MQCPVCRVAFYSYSGGKPRRYCGQECRYAAQKERQVLKKRRKRLAGAGFAREVLANVDSRLAEIGGDFVGSS